MQLGKQFEGLEEDNHSCLFLDENDIVYIQGKTEEEHCVGHLNTEKFKLAMSNSSYELYLNRNSYKNKCAK